ncbi:rod shape-determining protein MreD [Psychroserpens sp.]|uniref:rod shape-determining protein MreD n=1 Tax=Psychroserpens sp. TaxID=2020870 RepID=UPI001B05CA19|nr:rod shape-determining protein MreD [Psychroserpens sp.]MBO6605969.1 rod shape-determining protein MreD [Psychroserpens sp.]MBO6630895.1 rod shape-determining protein MreD [Psychroserpens sp.]MBO6652660.1 rod shape-determining protein MreD [Psychroserpens sp.]MBO6681568.1 rod shape-determining protein MreD [Psychroserpens sp.]MBO6749343.1 rod shape-determining protein MreD [Psychroserpens sp.]
MNSLNIANIIRFFALIVAQVLIFNHINFAGTINPYPYILFILLYPVNNNRTLFIFMSFLLGLIVDIFSDSGGVHAAACVTIAYIRPAILKFAFGMIYEHQTIRFNNTEIGNRIIYFSFLILIHHFLIFLLEIFNISRILMVFQKTLFSSIFTLILCILISTLFSKKQR